MRHLCGIILGVLFLQAGISQDDTYTTNGTCVMTSDDCFQLTQNGINGQIGSFFANEPLDLTQAFDFEFILNFGINDANGADGMVFVLQNLGLDIMGGSGGNIGYEGIPDSLSVAIEFDTWQNTDRGDPFFDHIGIISQGSTSHNPPSGLSPTVQSSTTSVNVEDDQDHFARIYWDPMTQELSVDFDCEFRLSQNIDLINDIFRGESMVYWGFTASTGGANNYQAVCLINNSASSIPEDCLEPGVVNLTAAGLEQGTFSWEPSGLFNDPNAQTVSADFQETTEIIINYTHPCGITGYSDTIIIYINDIEVDVTSNILDCYSDSLFLDGTSSDNEDVFYTWTTNDGELISGTDSQDAIGLGPGNYNFTVSDTISGCSRSLLYESPTNYIAPLLTSEVDGLLSCEMPVVTIEMIDLLNLDDYSFEWTTQNGSIVNTQNNTSQVNLAGTYTGTMTYLPTGCSESIDILVQNDPDFLNVSGFLQVPNIITPNGDEINEEFKAFYILDPMVNLGGKVKNYSMEIYNRWGNLVHFSDQVNENWTSYDNTDGVYYYVISYSDICDQGIENVLRGTVHVMR